MTATKRGKHSEENATHNFYKKSTNQHPAYFGDLDGAAGEFLEYEEVAKQEGMFVASKPPLYWQT